MKKVKNSTSVVGLFVSLLSLVATVPCRADPVPWSVAAGGNGHYYDVVNLNTASWDSARAAASSAFYDGMQGYLTTITSAEEQAFIFNTFLDTTPGPARYWLGGYKSPISGNWEWITGESWTYSNWWVTEPSGDGPSLEIYSTTIGPGAAPGTWNDEPAWEPTAPDGRGYLIEFEVVPVPGAALLGYLGLATALGVLRRHRTS